MNYKYEITGFEHYKFNTKNELINTHTSKIIKMTLINYTRGYWIGKKFYSLNKLRPLLKRPDKFNIPF